MWLFCPMISLIHLSNGGNQSVPSAKLMHAPMRLRLSCDTSHGALPGMMCTVMVPTIPSTQTGKIRHRNAFVGSPLMPRKCTVEVVIFTRNGRPNSAIILFSLSRWISIVSSPQSDQVLPQSNIATPGRMPLAACAKAIIIMAKAKHDSPSCPGGSS